MTVPWRLGAWRWAWPRVLAVALCVLGLLFQPADAMDLPAGNVVRLSQATRSEAGSLRPAYPPADSHSDTLSADLAVALPDNWDSTRTGMHNQAAAYAWYTLRFTAPSEWQSRSLGAYLPAVGMNAELFLNGQRIGSFGHMEEPVTRHFYTPLLFQLPAAMLRPSSEMNLLQVLVVGYPQHRNGLSEVFVGEMAALRPAWLWRGFWQNTGTLISSVLTIMLGVYVLMLWGRERSNAVFGWFGLAALIWGIRNLNLVITELPIPNLLWSKLGVLGAVAFVGFFALFALHYAESITDAGSRQSPHAMQTRERLVWLFLLVSSAALLSADTFDDSRNRFRYIAFVGIALTCWTQAKLSILAWKVRSSDTILIALAGLAYIALMMNDYMVTNDKQSLGQYYLRQYAALPLFIAIGTMLTRRYIGALETTQRFTESLQSQVQQQHDLLARNFDQMRGVERKQTQTQERERLMRDLHDGLGLHLLAALVQAKSPGTDAAMLANTLQDCLDDLRVAVDSLDGDERDPAAVLGTLRFRMAPRLEAAGIELGWEVDDEIPELAWLDPPKVLQLLRIVQEALTNAMRHSRASKVTIALRKRCEAQSIDMLEVSVTDNGGGFAVRHGGGRGLRNMDVRAASLGGMLTIEHLAHGSRVLLALPVQDTRVKNNSTITNEDGVYRPI